MKSKTDKLFERSSILEDSIRSLSHTLRYITGWDDIPVDLNFNRSALSNIAKGTEGKEPARAFGISVDSVSLNTESYNNFALSRRGVRGSLIEGHTNPKLGEDDSYVLFFKLTPVLVTCTIILYTKNSADVWDFIHGWFYNGRNANFGLKTYSTEFDIKVVLDEEISIPQSLEEHDGRFEIEVGMRVSTYVGDIVKVPAITTTKMNILSINDALKKCPDEVKPLTSIVVEAEPLIVSEKDRP